ncbi:MAG: hypothetical protein RLZZ74_366, partial [Cyanobacteriota bacterium]
MPPTNTIGTFEFFPASQAQVQTTMAGLRAISGTNGQYLNSVNQPFVLKKSAKLKKSPRIRPPSFS